MLDDQNVRWFLAGLSSATAIGASIASSKTSFDIAYNTPIGMTTWERIKSNWKQYIPSALLLGTSIACTLSGNIIANNVEAGLLLGLGAYAQNRERLFDAFDKEKARAPRLKTRYNEVLWFDATRGDDSGYFGATPEDFLIAMYELELELQEEKSVSYGDFYRFLQVPVPPMADLKGWSIGAGIVYGYETIRFKRELITLDDGLECNVFRFVHEPTYDYLDYTPDEDLWENRENISRYYGTV